MEIFEALSEQPRTATVRGLRMVNLNYPSGDRLSRLPGPLFAAGEPCS